MGPQIDGPKCIKACVGHDLGRIDESMSKRTLYLKVERFDVAGSFTISRGAKRHVDVLTAEIHQDGCIGRGEATAIYYLGETAEGLQAEAEALRSAIEDGLDKKGLQRALPAGGARKALDCALWDLEAKLTGVPIWQRIGLSPPQPLTTAYTISLAEPAEMEAAARKASHYTLLKLKLSGEGDVERVAAVRKGAPQSRLIVDANEAWAAGDIEAKAHALHGLGVELIEQPVPAGQDHLLEHVQSPIPLCADETVHDCASLEAVYGRYQFINIKLDKSGGLSEALALVAQARAHGLGLMTGCMLSTSLGVAPAFYIGQQSQFVDLDGPLLLAQDRAHPIVYEGARMFAPTPALWG